MSITIENHSFVQNVYIHTHFTHFTYTGVVIDPQTNMKKPRTTLSTIMDDHTIFCKSVIMWDAHEGPEHVEFYLSPPGPIHDKDQRDPPFVHQLKCLYVGLVQWALENKTFPHQKLMKDLQHVCIAPHKKAPYWFVAVLLLCAIKQDDISRQKGNMQKINPFKYYLEHKGHNAVTTILSLVEAKLLTKECICNVDKIWIHRLGLPELPFSTLIDMIDYVQVLYGSGDVKHQDIVDRCDKTKSVVMEYMSKNAVECSNL